MDQIGAPKTPATVSRTNSERSVEDVAVEEERVEKEEEEQQVQVPAKRRRGLSIASEDIDKSDTDLMDQDDDDDALEMTIERNLDAEDGIGMPDRTSSPIPGFPSLRSTPYGSQNNSSIDTLDTPELASSPPLPPAKLRQLTLDTQGTSWALELAGSAVGKKLGTGRDKEEGKTGKNSLKEMRRGLKQFLNPGQKGSERMEVDEVDEVDDEEEEEEEEEAVKMEEGEDEEDDIVVVDNRAAEGDLDLSDDEVMIVPSQGKEIDDDDVLIIESAPQVQEEAAEVDLERIAHLAFLDSVTRIPPTFTPEIVGIQQATDTTLPFSFDSIAHLWSTSSSIASSSKISPSPVIASLNGASVDQENEAAEATLSRVVNKEDFESMQVIGQFNLGFIIARRTVSLGKGKGKEGEEGGAVQDDLFIVDQHASDEIYNFERLQADTIIQSQRLLQ